jgi:hypothetical protein
MNIDEMTLSEAKIVLNKVRTNPSHSVISKWLMAEDVILAELDNKDKEIKLMEKAIKCNKCDCNICMAHEEIIKLKEQCVSKDKIIGLMVQEFINNANTINDKNSEEEYEQNRLFIITHFENLAKEEK